mmetsp:Transcript_117655/g.186249  ORF Transcript_117655/g.186249 Transcript_117655/m.186249 type:complete len:216 (-) Transcript_117655:38-685(-)
MFFHHVSRVQAMILLFPVIFPAEEYTGYVVDNYCWDKPNHVGIDGSQLGTAPGTHILHCLWQVSACKNQGYVMLEQLSSPAPDGATYGPKYQLDATGDALVFEMAQAEQTRGGDRAFDERITVTGTVSGSEMAVSKLCITPQANNPSQDTFCYGDTGSSSSSTTTGSGAGDGDGDGSTSTKNGMVAMTDLTTHAMPHYVCLGAVAALVTFGGFLL